MKKGFIILIIFILVCIAGGSFLAIHLIRNIEVNETSIVKEPLNHEGIENFTSVNLDLTSMDVKIEKSSENAISYRLQDVKKQKLDYSVDDGVLTVKEIILDKHFVGHDDNEVIIYTTNDSLIVNGNLVAGDVEIQSKVKDAGLEIIEARITYLAYAPEIAAVMLQRQQASAIIDARKMIVDGAVGMVEMALDRLNENGVVELDEERKAAMVSNLLVVLCGNHDAQPVVNSGSLY